MWLLVKLLIGLEKAYNKTVDYLEDQQKIELGELRQFRETVIQKEIAKKKAIDARANTPLDDDSLRDSKDNRD